MNKKTIKMVDIKHLVIKGVKTHYYESIWVEDKNEIDGGSFQSIVKKYDKPKILIDFLAEVNIELKTGSIYTDGDNLFIATSKNEIMIYSKVVDSFSIPEELCCICTEYLV